MTIYFEPTMHSREMEGQVGNSTTIPGMQQNSSHAEPIAIESEPDHSIREYELEDGGISPQLYSGPPR
jgi:hypothetical protein